MIMFVRVPCAESVNASDLLRIGRRVQYAIRPFPVEGYADRLAPL